MAKEKVQTILLQVVYPEIVAFLRHNVGREGTIEALHRMGRNAGKTISESWRPKGNKLMDIVKDVFKNVLDNKSVKIEIEKETGRLRIIDNECRLCTEGLEVGDINYCEIISGCIEEFINIEREIYVQLPKVRVSTVKSRASGAEYCEHLIEIE